MVILLNSVRMSLLNFWKLLDYLSRREVQNGDAVFSYITGNRLKKGDLERVGNRA